MCVSSVGLQDKGPDVPENDPMTASGRGFGRPAVALLALLAIYFAGASAVHFAPGQGAVASWWPAAGIAVALLALSPRTCWPWLAAGVVVASGLANVTGGREWPVALCFGVANAAEAVVAALVLRGGEDERPELLSLDDFLRLVRAAVIGAVTIATGAAVTVVAFDTGSFGLSWSQVFSSHAASTLVVVPAALARGTGTARRRPVELLAQFLALSLVTVAVFASPQSLPLAFAPLPLLVWSALRFDVRTVAAELLLASALCTVLTAEGLGPFGAAVANGESSAGFAGAMVQIWLLSAAVMSLPLTVVIEQRRQLLAELTSREELFRRNFTDSLTGMLLLRPRGDRLEVIDANLAALRLLGGATTPLVGRYLDRILDSPAGVRRHLQQVVSGELAGWSAEVGLIDQPGVRINIAVSVLAAGRERVFSAQLLDVTVEHDARTRIEAAEQLTSATLDTTAGVVILTDLQGRALRVNAATCELTGFAEDELLGRPVWETLTPPELVEMIRRRYASPGAAALKGSQESDVLCRDGHRLRMLWKNNLVLDENGDTRYVVLTGLDVTEERRFAGLVTHLLNASISTALVGIDGDGRITLVNSGAQHLLGYTAEEVVGRPFLDLLDRDEVLERTARSDRPGTFGALAATIGPRGESRPSDWRWVAVDGSQHTMSMTLSQADGEGQVGYLCVGRDVTEQRHSQEMLIVALEKERTAVERLRVLDAAKNDFVSTVSHELRTPVTSIVGYTEMLREGEVVEPLPEQVPMLATIARNGDRLITICNDLLTLGGLDSGATTWERDIVDLTSMIEHVEDSLRPLLGSRDLDVAFERPDEPVTVVGDRVQLERAMNNLLSNALKFTEDGGRVRCRLEHDDDQVRMVVSDTGIGIPLDEQHGLFEKFFRSSTAQERAIPGTGLGLSIVAGIVASHGGRVAVESAHLEGTTFTVVLPGHTR